MMMTSISRMMTWLIFMVGRKQTDDDDVVFRFGGAVLLTVPKRTPRLVGLHTGKATTKLFCFQNFMANPRHFDHTLKKN